MAEGGVNGRTTTTKSFVLMNVPDLEHDCGFLIDYLEKTLPGIKVHSLQLHPGIPNRALVVLDEEIDITVAKYPIYQEPLKDQYLRLQLAEATNYAVIVKRGNFLQKHPPSALKQYFQCMFGDGEEIVTACVQIPQSSDIVVSFMDAEVTRRVLECEFHLPIPTEGCKIEVQPFFSNFHGLLSYRGKYFHRILEENCCSQSASEYSPFHHPNEEVHSHSSENKPPSTLKSKVGPRQDIDMRPQYAEENVKEKPVWRSIEKGFNGQMRDIIEEEKNTGMRTSFPVTDYGKVPGEFVEKTFNIYSFYDDQTPAVANGLPTNKSSAGGNAQLPKVPLIANPDKIVKNKMGEKVLSPSSSTAHDLQTLAVPQSTEFPPIAKPDENTMKMGEDVCSFSLSKALWKLMRDKIKSENNEMTYNEEREMLIVKGKNIDRFMESYRALNDCVKECHILLDENMQMVLNSHFAKDHLTLRLKDVEWIIDKGFINIYSLNEWSFDCVKGKVTDIIKDFKRTTVQSYMSGDEYLLCKTLCEKLRPVQISFSDSSLTVSGKRDSVNEVTEHLGSISKVRLRQELGRQPRQSSAQFSETHYNLLMMFYTEELNEILKSVKYAWKPEQEGKVTIEFNGSLIDVSKVEENLRAVQRSIQTEVIDVLAEFGSDKNSLLMQRLSALNECDPLFYGKKSFENEFKCIIKNVVRIETSSQATGAIQCHKRGPERSFASDVDSDKQKCTFRVRSSIQFEIKNYDIILEEMSDVLVCILPYHRQLMATFVGQAFLKALPGLQDKVNCLPLSDNNVAFVNLKTLGSLSVNLAFMILSRSPNLKSFRQGVTEVLKGASQLDAHSVSFHLLEIEYPDDFISENFFSALQCMAKYLTRTNLQKISFLATGKNLYERMTHDAPGFFSLIPLCGESLDFDESNSVSDEKENGDFSFQEKKLEIQIIHREFHDIACIWKSRLERLIRVTHET